MSIDAPDAVAEYLALSQEAVQKSGSPATLANLIKAKTISLLGVTKLLAEPLTSEDAKQRARGIGLLAAILGKLPADIISRHEVRYLTDFFTSDSTLSTESIVEALTGLTVLSGLPVFGHSDAIQVAKAIFDNIEMRKHHQSIRFLVYSLFDVLLTRHKNALKTLGPDFIKKYCTMADGEKDPRNLKIAFDLDRTILLEFDIQDCVEDLFDITFCYFPITFTPPPDDPYGISSEELQKMLRRTLASHSALGPLATPLILEKLSTSSKSAKRQSMELIIEAAPVYGQAAFDDLAEAIWQALSLEVFNATDSALENLAYEAMRTFLATIVPGEDAPAEITGKGRIIADRIAKVCIGEIKEPQKVNAKGASKILGYASSSSLPLSRFFLDQTLPAFLSLLHDNELVAQRPVTFGLIEDFFTALSHRSPFVDFASVNAHKDELLSYLVSGIQQTSTAPPAIKAAIEIAKIRQIFGSSDLNLIVGTLNELLTPHGDQEMAEAALVGLQALSDIVGPQIQATTCPILLEQIPSRNPADTDYKTALNALTRLCMPSDLFEYFMLRILSRLEALDGERDSETPANNLLTHHLLFAMKAAIDLKFAKDSNEAAKCVPKIAPRLFKMFGSASSLSTARLLLVDEAAKVIQLLLQHASDDYQTTYVNTHIAPRLVSLAVFNDDAAFAIVAAWCLVAAKPSSLSMVNVPEVWSALYTTSTTGPISRECDALNAALACLSNKHAKILAETISGALVHSNGQDLELQTFSWIARGLVPLNDPLGIRIVDKLIDICGSEAAASIHAAKALGNVLIDGDSIVSKTNHCNFRLLYKQKYFTTTLQKLTSRLSAFQPNTNYLSALAGLLDGMPKQLAIVEVPKHINLFIRALDIEDISPLAKSSIIKTCTKIINEDAEVLEQAISGLVSSLTKIVAGQNAATNTTRVDALQALTIIAEKYDYLTLSAHRMKVLRLLAQVVDDKRKVVRREAVECRAAWLLNTPDT